MEFTHFNENGKASMVDISSKPDTERAAIANGCIKMKKETIDAIKNDEIKKGDVLTVAKVAGIMSAKRVDNLIPMTHNICLTQVDFKFDVLEDRIEIEACVKTIGKTGVEIEALTAVSVAGLTIYDMCKSVDKDMVIGEIRLVKKTGGKTDYEDPGRGCQY